MAEVLKNVQETGDTEMTEQEKIISLARACSKPDTSDCYHNKYFTLDIEELETFFKAAQNVAYEKATRVCELAVEQCKDTETKLDITELGLKQLSLALYIRLTNLPLQSKQ